MQGLPSHTMQLPSPLVITLPMPAVPWGANQAATSAAQRISLHQRKKAVRDTTTLVARSHLRHVDLPLPPCDVHVSIPFSTNRKRDPHNYTSTVVKAVIDGLRIAGCWPDDDPTWVRVLDPICEVGTDLTITITPRTP